MVYIKNFNQTIFLSEIIRLRKKILKSFFRLKKIKNFFSLQLFRLFGLTNPFPYSIIIEPTSVCNLKCPMCPKVQKKTNLPEGFMNLKDFKKIINDVKDYVFFVFLHHNGEPLLHKGIISMIRYANKNNILTHISTNLNLNNDRKIKELAHSGIDFISIPLDGAKKETYEKYRKKGDFNRVIRNIKLLVKEKKKTSLIEVQFVIMKENECEIDDIKELAKNLKVDRLALKAVYTENSYYDKKFQPTNRIYRTQFKKTAKCSYPFSRPVVAWNGLMFPCCSTNTSLDKKYSFGDVFEKSFKDIWLAEEYQTFRRTVLKDSNRVKTCPGCFLNEIVKNRWVLKLN